MIQKLILVFFILFVRCTAKFGSRERKENTRHKDLMSELSESSMLGEEQLQSIEGLSFGDPNFTPPPCISDESDLAYKRGVLSATETLFNCFANIIEPTLLPNFYNGTVYGYLTVYSSIQLNNLHEINAVDGTCTIDFYHRLYWKDDRFAMPLFWDRMSAPARTYGIELTSFLSNDSIDFFLPDIRFHDVASVEYIIQTLRLNASNYFFWSRHTLVTLMQPKFQFSRYPSDTQIIHLRFGSYAFNKNFLRMAFTTNPKPITFNENFDRSYTFLDNPSWTYKDSETTYELYVSGSNFLNVIYHIAVERQGNGIVLRLILPITLLCFLGGLTFWAEYGARVDTTITLLLAVSALYIVILANIPLVGYLTSMDEYIFWMFLLLCFAVILHQTYASLQEDQDAWPLRILYSRFIEAVGRLAVFPIVAALFIIYIPSINPKMRMGMIIITSVVSGCVLLREIVDVRHHYHVAVHSLLKKLNSADILLKELSSFELFLLNRLEFQRWSFSPFYLAEYLGKEGELEIPQSRSPRLRTYSQVVTSATTTLDDREDGKDNSDRFSQSNPQRRSSNIRNDRIPDQLENRPPNLTVNGQFNATETRLTLRETATLRRIDSDDDYSPQKKYFR